MKFCRQKIQSQNVTREKLCEALLYKKRAQKNVDEIDTLIVRDITYYVPRLILLCW